MALLQIKNTKEFDDWLRDRPPAVAYGLAIRVAIRAVPAFNEIFKINEKSLHIEQVCSRMFRAASAAWSSGIFPEIDLREKLVRAAAYAESASHYDQAPIASAVAKSMAASCRAYGDRGRPITRDNYDETATRDPVAREATRRYAVHAVESAVKAFQDPEDVLIHLGDDMAWLEKYGRASDARADVAKLFGHGLWLSSVPNWVMASTDLLFSQWARMDPDSSVWRDWYTSRIQNQPSFYLKQANATDIDLRLASHPDDWWERGPSLVNQDIKNEINSNRSGSEPPRVEAWPSTSTIPGQNPVAVSFSSPLSGPLSPSTDSDDDPLDVEQAELYRELRAQLEEVLSETPSQEILQIGQQIRQFLAQPPEWKNVRFKKILWLHGNALRAKMARHDAASGVEEPHYDKLPVALSDSLRLPVQTWNVLSMGDPVLSSLDAVRLGPQEAGRVESEMTAAVDIIDAAIANRSVTAEATEELIKLERSLVASAKENIHGGQAKVVSNETNKNLIGRAIMGAYQTAIKISKTEMDEAGFAAREFKSGFYKTAGAGAAAVVAGVAIAGYSIGWPYVEFVASNAPSIKSYLSLLYANPQLNIIVDHIVSVRNWVEVNVHLQNGAKRGKE